MEKARICFSHVLLERKHFFGQTDILQQAQVMHLPL